MEVSGIEIDDDLVEGVARRDEGSVERAADRQQQSERKAHHRHQSGRQVGQSAVSLRVSTDVFAISARPATATTAM